MVLSAIAAITMASAPVPNVVIVLVDDLGWQDTSLAFGLSEKLVGRRLYTPNLASLAARGTTINQAYSSCTVCSPTRAALMTGVNPARSHITSWVHSGQSTDNGHPEVRNPGWKATGLQPGDYPTMPEAMRSAGYRTVFIGKAHFGAAGTPGANPLNLGFDRSIAGSAAGHPSSFYGKDRFARPNSKPGDPPAHNDVLGLEAYHGKDVYLEEALAAEASREIAEAHKDRKPIYLQYAPYAVHTPIQANRRLLGRYKGLDPVEAAYATMVESVDQGLGKIIQAFRKAGTLEQTIFVFTSDNGGLSQTARGGAPNLHNLPLRSGKGSAYEGGIRVPMVVAGPGIAKGVALDRRWVTTADIFATVGQLANVSVQPQDGVSFADALRTGKDADRGAPNLWHYPHHRGFGGPGLEPHTSLRDGDFKVIYFYRERRWELYNVRNDIGETRDISVTQPQRLRDMAGKLVGEMNRLGAQLPLDASGRELSPVLPPSPQPEK